MCITSPIGYCIDQVPLMASKLFYTVRVLLCLQLSIIHLNLAWQQGVVHVIPDQMDSRNYTRCSTNITECYNLTELIQHCVVRSNLIISFLPGTHTAQVHRIMLYKINDVANFSLAASNWSTGATIDCNNLIGFVFLSVTNLQIHGLTFINCRGSLLYETKGRPTFANMYIGKSENVSISNMSIQNGIIGTGLFVELARGNFTISQSKFTHNKQNFCFLTGDLNISSQYYTNLIVTDSVFTHGKQVFEDYRYGTRTIEPGITLKLSQRGFTLLRNISVMNNYFSNLIIKFNVCVTNLTIENLFSSNCENGLSLIVSTHCDLPVEEGGVVSVKNASFVNTRIFAANTEPDSSISHLLPSRKWYRIILANISIKGSHPREDKLFNTNPIEFYKVRLEIRNSIFMKTDGIRMRNSLMIIKEQFLYERNSAGVVLLTDSSCYSSSDLRAKIVLITGSTVVFRNNVVKNDHKSILYATDSTISMNKQSTIIFESNTGVVCGGILLVKSKLTFSGSGEKVLNFSHNQGATGGALALFDGSYLRFGCKNTKLSFIGNKASESGGAIYVHNLGYVDHHRSQLKPFYIVSPYCRRRPVFYSHFENNTAQLGGSALYGGWLDSYQSQDPFSLLKNNDEDPSFVSSDPVRVCPCTLSESRPDCNVTEIHTEKIYPGQSLELSVVAVGQRSGIVPSIVEIRISIDSDGEFDKTQYTQEVGLQCTTLTFTLRSSAKVEKIQLLNSVRNIHVNTLNGPVIWNPSVQSEQLGVTFLLKDCPLGFYFHHVEKRCSCQSALLQEGIQCNFNAFEILRPSPKWINATFERTGTSNNISTGPGVIVHRHCPFDYCKLTTKELPLRLDNPDVQCAFNRSGILCGACQSHFSHMLGTSQCKKCSSVWIALIVPMMAMAGIILVAFLIALNLTVSVGSISGLIFYANIVRANNAVFFLPGINNSSLGKFSSFLSTFIAWLNLDLGFEICLYDGLTAYVKTWLQYLFPLYIWLLVIAIIVACRYSVTASRLCGNNAVQVLATLFLLSYAKLLRLIITTFSFTELVYPDGYHRRIWLYDGNVDYLKGKHIPLFTAALLLLLLISIPFTGLLFFIQCLQRWSPFKFLIQLQPLFDAYTGPYKIKHRYWTGLLLFMRACLFLVFSLNSLGDPKINMLAIVITMFGLLTYISFIGGVYKLWSLNLLENAFILNLGILSAAVSFYQNNTSTIIPSFTCASVGISLVLFVIIVLCHLVLKLSKLQGVHSLRVCLKRRILSGKGDEMLAAHASQLNSQDGEIIVTRSVVEMESTVDDLSEPLIVCNEI